MKYADILPSTSCGVGMGEINSQDRLNAITIDVMTERDHQSCGDHWKLG